MTAIRMARFPLALTVILGLAACDPDETPPPGEDAEPESPAEDLDVAGLSSEQEAFWDALEDLCGEAFPSVGDEDEEDGEMVMHVRHCEEEEIQIPLHIGDDRSRTWIVTRQDEGLRLKHDHRYEDGTEEDLTWYGGDTQDAGFPEAQDFYADDETAEMLPEAAGNVWTMELEPGDTFVYQLIRDGDMRARWTFDLTDPVDPPPAPWGYEDTEPTH